MANILKNVDKIVTTAGTEVDLDNISSAQGKATGGTESLVDTCLRTFPAGRFVSSLTYFHATAPRVSGARG